MDATEKARPFLVLLRHFKVENSDDRGCGSYHMPGREVFSDILTYINTLKANHKNVRVLDFGCGNINDLRHYIYVLFSPFFSINSRCIVACDSDPKLHSWYSFLTSVTSIFSIEWFSRFLQKRNISFVKNLEELSGDLKYDLIVSFNALAYLTDPLSKIIELLYKLKEKGRAYLHLESLYIDPIKINVLGRLLSVSDQKGPIFHMTRNDIPALEEFKNQNPLISNELYKACLVAGTKYINWPGVLPNVPNSIVLNSLLSEADICRKYLSLKWFNSSGSMPFAYTSVRFRSDPEELSSLLHDKGQKERGDNYKQLSKCLGFFDPQHDSTADKLKLYMLYMKDLLCWGGGVYFFFFSSFPVGCIILVYTVYEIVERHDKQTQNNALEQFKLEQLTINA